MPYHSPYGGDHRDNGWQHRGRDRDHDHHHDGFHHGFGVYGVYGWAGYPYWPWWGWNYPFLTDSWDESDYDSQPAGNYAASQYPEYTPGPYDDYPADQTEPQRPEYTPWPYSSPAPSPTQHEPSAPAALQAPVTLVFKDGRPNEQIHNYLLTSTTLSVLDQRRRDIPVSQLDVEATVRANREAGIEFSLPGGGR